MIDRDKVARAIVAVYDAHRPDGAASDPTPCPTDAKAADAAIAAVLDGVERVFDEVRSEPGISDHDRLLINTLLAETKAAFLQADSSSNPAE